jgi:NAD(P)H-hydrate repair Nnr-like enzyme with NAD(P)H-hydrate dehydratase domain
MAKAGSGDVLSGFAAGLIARADDLVLATATAAYTFGLAGEYAVKEEHNEYSVVASDIITAIPKVIHSLF